MASIDRYGINDVLAKLFGNFEAEIIYNSVDPKKFDPFKQYKDLRPELGLSPQDIVIASVARFTYQKQPWKLIAAFAEVSKQVPNAKLLMVGDGEQKGQAIALIRRLGIENKVVLQPFRQDVPDVLAASDIFVLPSLWEAFPIALLEAMSMGRAVIGTDVDGTPEIIEHEVNGLLVKTEPLEEQLEAAITRLCLDHDLRGRLMKNAISSIYKKYNSTLILRAN